VIRDRDDSRQWLVAALCLSRAVRNEEDVRRAGPWIVASLGERPDLPPAGVVADVGALLHGERLLTDARVRRITEDARLEAALRRYEDTFLGRLSTDSRVAAAADAMARLPTTELRALGVGIFAASIVAHTGFDRGVAVQPGIVRTAMTRPREVFEQGFSVLRDVARVRETLAEAYEALARGAQQAHTLVSDADVFVIENLPTLRNLTQRLAIVQVVQACEVFTEALPRRIRSTRSSLGPAPTAYEDDSEYPVGGFSSMSTSGSIENLVASELIFMETRDATKAQTERTVDLFDMRYVEGELLYYTRDEAILLRQRRIVTFLLGDDLESTRVKDRALPWQRIVLLLGLLMATIKKMSADLGHEALQFRVVFVRGSAHAPSALKGERDLCELALREWRSKGMLEVVECTLESEADTLATMSRNALVEVVVVSTDGAGTKHEWLEAARARKLEGRVPCVLYEVGLAKSANLDVWRESSIDLVSALL